MVKTPLADPQRTGRGLPVFIVLLGVSFLAGGAGAALVAGSGLMSGDAGQEIASATGGSFGGTVRNFISVQEIGMTLPANGTVETGFFLNHVRFSDPSYGPFRFFTMGGSLERLVGGGGMGLRAGIARATGGGAGDNLVGVTELFIRVPLGVPGLGAGFTYQTLISRDGFFHTIRVGMTVHGSRSGSPARARG